MMTPGPAPVAPEPAEQDAAQHQQSQGLQVVAGGAPTYYGVLNVTACRLDGGPNAGHQRNKMGNFLLFFF